MFVQVALPINSARGYYELDERLNLDVRSTGKTQIYTYSNYLSERRDNDFEFGMFTIGTNINNIYSGTGAPQSTISSYDNFDITRNMPSNPVEYQRFSNQGSSIGFSSLGTTVTENTCLLINLKMANEYQPRNMRLKDRYVDFYCQLSCLQSFDVAKMHAFLFVSSNITAITGAVNFSPKSTQSIELEVNKKDNVTYSISGLIPNDSSFYESEYWASGSGRLYLCIFVEDLQGFGCSTLESIVRFPYGNCDTWYNLWSNDYIVPIDQYLFNSIYSQPGLPIDNALNYLGGLISGVGLWFTTIGFLNTILPFSVILTLAIIIILLEKLAL